MPMLMKKSPLSQSLLFTEGESHRIYAKKKKGRRSWPYCQCEKHVVTFSEQNKF